MPEIRRKQTVGNGILASNHMPKEPQMDHSLSQIAEMDHGNIIDFQTENQIAAALRTVIGIMERIDAFNQDILDVVFAGAINHKRIAAQSRDIIVILVIVGNGDDIGFAIGQFQTEPLAERIGNHGNAIGADFILQFKTGMSEPSKNHKYSFKIGRSANLESP